jgi:hypothetical protein
MINELPQLFGKNFLIGYVLPAALTAFALMGLLDLHGLTASYAAIADFIREGSDKLPLGQFGLIALIIWAAAVFLLGVNYKLTRLLEGYGRFNPAWLWRWNSLRAFRKLEAEMAAHDDSRDHAYSAAAIAFSANFPEREDLVLPTRFGNIMRAAERYAQIVYAMDSIQIWTRLLAVAPQAHLDRIDDAKASLDFWINLWFGAAVVAGAEIALWTWSGYSGGPGIALAAVLAAILAAKAAQAAALQFGALVKATFDLYRKELCVQLGLDWPHTLHQERALWQAVSQTMLFRDADAAND